MDQSIEQMSQDLARAGYAKSTQERYVATAKELGARFGKPIRDLSRDEVREFVDAVVAKGQGFSTTNKQLSAVMFLFRKTLGRPQDVSFVKLRRTYDALPPVLSLKESTR